MSREKSTRRPGSEITQKLELTDKKIKVIMIHLLMSLVVKIGNINEQMGKFYKDMESIIENQMEIIGIKNMLMR